MKDPSAPPVRIVTVKMCGDEVMKLAGWLLVFNPMAEARTALILRNRDY